MKDIQCSPLAWHTHQIASFLWKTLYADGHSRRLELIKSVLLSPLLVHLFINYFGISLRFCSSNQEATHFRLMGFRRNLLELLYLKSCQRKHGERGGRAGGLEQTQAALGHTHDASCTQKAWWQHIHLISSSKVFFQWKLRVEQRGGGTANLSLVTKLNSWRSAWNVKIPDPGKWQ